MKDIIRNMRLDRRNQPAVVIQSLTAPFDFVFEKMDGYITKNLINGIEWSIHGKTDQEKAQAFVERYCSAHRDIFKEEFICFEGYKKK